MIQLIELLRLLAPYVEIERGGSDGSIQQRERLYEVAEFMVKRVEGDFVEIGCLHGSTTVLFAQVAQRFDRRVLAIDPWQIGTQNCEGGEYEIFLRTIKPYANIVDVVRESSAAPEVVARLKRTEIAFAFVDGLHEYNACLQDIQSVHHAYLIAVDDTNGWSKEVARAFKEGAREKTQISNPNFRESYLL